MERICAIFASIRAYKFCKYFNLAKHTNKFCKNQLLADILPNISSNLPSS